jgi:hypothetical protein
MRHLKCLTCRTRLYSTEGDPIGDLCPVCGSPLAALRASGDDVNGHRLLPATRQNLMATHSDQPLRACHALDATGPSLPQHVFGRTRASRGWPPKVMCEGGDPADESATSIDFRQ